LGFGGGEGRLRDPGQADPGALDVTRLIQPHDRGDADRREVTDLALELLVGTGRAAWAMGDPDLGQDLGRLDGRLERVEEELARRDRSLARLAPTHDRAIAR